MRSIQVTSLEGPGSVTVAEVPDIAAEDGEVLVEVRALGISWPDLLQTRGQYQRRPVVPFQLGIDLAGEVRSAPADSGFSPGDRVSCMVSSGGGADLVSVPVDSVFPLPPKLTFDEGAAIPMNYFTAWYALVDRGEVTTDSTVLVTGASGGVGTATLQIARAFGARTIAVVSTPEKAEFARGAGAHEAVLATDFLSSVRSLTGGVGVDLVVDMVGEPLITDALRSLAPQGRLMVVGFTGGQVPHVALNRLLLRDIDVRGVGWSGAMNNRARWDQLLPMIESGDINPPIGKVYELERVVEALMDMQGRRTLGKSVVRF